MSHRVPLLISSLLFVSACAAGTGEMSSAEVVADMTADAEPTPLTGPESLAWIERAHREPAYGELGLHLLDEGCRPGGERIASSTPPLVIVELHFDCGERGLGAVVVSYEDTSAAPLVAAYAMFIDYERHLSWLIEAGLEASPSDDVGSAQAALVGDPREAHGVQPDFDRVDQRPPRIGPRFDEALVDRPIYEGVGRARTCGVAELAALEDARRQATAQCDHDVVHRGGRAVRVRGFFGDCFAFAQHTFDCVVRITPHHAVRDAVEPPAEAEFPPTPPIEELPPAPTE